MRWIGAILLLLAGAASARADIQPLPYIITTIPVHCPTISGNTCTIAAGGTSQVALNANSGRKMFCLSNPSTASEPLYFDFGQAASLTLSQSIPAGSNMCFGGGLIWQGSVTVNATTTSHAFSIEDFQ